MRVLIIWFHKTTLLIMSNDLDGGSFSADNITTTTTTAAE